MPISRKKYIIVLCAALAAFLVLFALTALLSKDIGSDAVSGGEHPLRISEIMQSNTAYPNAEGVCCDWIEIENTSLRDFNVSGYRLSDDITEAKYAFPVGTVIPAGGFAVVYCDAGRGGEYAPFSLSNLGGETILLMNSANTVLDSVETLHGVRNASLIRTSDGGFTVSNTPTPGFSNDEAGYTAYLAAAGQGKGDLRISEVMSAAKLFTAPNGESCDWIEIENTSAMPADLSGLHLSDKEGEARYTFPAGTTLAPGGFTVVWCSGTEEGGEYAAFKLDKTGESVILSDKEGVALDRVAVPFTTDDTAYARTETGWRVTERPTPGFSNDDAGYTAFVASRGFGSVDVRINEVCLRNVTGAKDADGEVCDWIELYNAGGESVSLEGWYLSDKTEELARWRIPALTLAPGEYAVIFASGKNRTEGELHTDFSLSAGETLYLVTPIGTAADSVECPLTEDDAAFARLADGTWAEGAPTFGAENGGGV